MASLYLAYVHKEETSCYGVSFPDFPGCIGASDINIENAIENATRSLALHVEGMLEEKLPVPEASTVDSLFRDAEFNELMKGGTTLVLIPLKISLGKIVRVNVTFDENTLELIDREVKTRRMTRSSFLAKAAKNMIA